MDPLSAIKLLKAVSINLDNIKTVSQLEKLFFVSFDSDCLDNFKKAINLVKLCSKRDTYFYRDILQEVRLLLIEIYDEYATLDENDDFKPTQFVYDVKFENLLPDLVWVNYEAIDPSYGVQPLFEWMKSDMHDLGDDTCDLFEFHPDQICDCLSGMTFKEMSDDYRRSLSTVWTYHGTTDWDTNEEVRELLFPMTPRVYENFEITELSRMVIPEIDKYNRGLSDDEFKSLNYQPDNPTAKKLLDLITEFKSLKDVEHSLFEFVGESQTSLMSRFRYVSNDEEENHRSEIFQCWLDWRGDFAFLDFESMFLEYFRTNEGHPDSREALVNTVRYYELMCEITLLFHKCYVEPPQIYYPSLR